MNPFKNWASNNASDSPSISFSEAQIGERATVETSGGSGSASNLLINPLFKNELNTSKTSQHTVSMQSSANTAVINGTWTIDFPAKNLNNILVRWTTLFNNANDSESYLAWIRVRNTSGVTTTIQDRINRNSSALLTTELTGEWYNINRIQVGLYSYSYGEDGGSYGTDVNGYAEINMSFIVAYDGIDVFPLYIQGNSSNRQVCYTNNESPLKFQSINGLKNIAIINDSDPDLINSNVKKMLGFQGNLESKWILGV